MSKYKKRIQKKIESNKIIINLLLVAFTVLIGYTFSMKNDFFKEKEQTSKIETVRSKVLLEVVKLNDDYNEAIIKYVPIQTELYDEKKSFVDLIIAVNDKKKSSAELEAIEKRVLEYQNKLTTLTSGVVLPKTTKTDDTKKQTPLDVEREIAKIAAKIEAKRKANPVVVVNNPKTAKNEEVIKTTTPVVATETSKPATTVVESSPITVVAPTEKATFTGIATPAMLDKLPVFPGGIDEFYKYVISKFEAPEEVENTVIVRVTFVIEIDGSMSNIKTIGTSNPKFGVEAVRVLNTLRSKWAPGYIDNHKVRTQYTLPIGFKPNND
jgi:hypothetical protein